MKLNLFGWLKRKPKEEKMKSCFDNFPQAKCRGCSDYLKCSMKSKKSMSLREN